MKSLARRRLLRPPATLRRHATTSAAVAIEAQATANLTPSTKKEGTVTLPPRLATRNLLKVSIDLAKRCFDQPQSLVKAVDAALEDLQQPRRPVIAFWGDSKSGVRDVVTALLEEPLSDDQVRRNALIGRHDDRAGPSSLRISSSQGTEVKPGQLILRSTWLEQVNADMMELIDMEVAEALPHLLAADHIALVTDNIRFLSQPDLAALLQVFNSHPSAQVLLNRINKSSTPFADEQQLVSEFSSQPTSVSLPVSSVSSNDALDALDLFRSSTHSSSSAAIRSMNMELYQSKQEASAVSSLSTSLLKAVQPPTSTPTDVENYHLQARTGLFLASYVLSTSQAGIDEARVGVYEAEKRVQALHKLVGHRLAAQRTEFYGAPTTDPTKKQEDAADPEEVWIVKHSAAQSAKQAEKVLETYKWWNLPWKVDDLGTEMRDVVVDHYGKDMENKIYYQSGRLASLSSSLSAASDATVSFPPNSPFHSPILLNTLAQQAGTHITTFSSPLLAPRSSRRLQLTSALIPQLHARAQRLVATFYLSTFSSFGLAWSAAISDLLSTDVSLGLATLGLAGSVRWTIGRWERIRRRFWEGWKRVEEGLGRDVRKAYEGQVEESVSRRTKVAAEGLEELVVRRATAVDEVEEELKVHMRTRDTLRRTVM